MTYWGNIELTGRAIAGCELRTLLINDSFGNFDNLHLSSVGRRFISLETFKITRISAI